MYKWTVNHTMIQSSLSSAYNPPRPLPFPQMTRWETSPYCRVSWTCVRADNDLYTYRHAISWRTDACLYYFLHGLVNIFIIQNCILFKSYQLHSSNTYKVHSIFKKTPYIKVLKTIGSKLWPWWCYNFYKIAMSAT